MTKDNRFTDSTMSELAKFAEAHGVSIAVGTDKIPTVDDLNTIIKAGNIVLRKDVHDGLIEYSTDPVASSKVHDHIVVSVIPGLRITDVQDGKHQSSTTQLLRGVAVVKKGSTEDIIEQVNFICPGPFSGPLTFLNAVGEVVNKLLRQFA